jgi:glycosyltransferase involved in cell wall biosynthesis
VPYGNYLLVKRVTRQLLDEYISSYGMPDLIHAHAAIFAGAAVAELARQRNIPVVQTEHSSGFSKGAYRGWQSKLAGNAYRHSKACIAVSPSLAELVENQVPSTRGRWVWVPNMVSDRFSLSDDSGSPGRTGYPPVFLSLALMKEGKGHFDLIRSFRRLVSDGYNAELWLAGDGPLRKALNAEVERLGISHKVRFLGLIAPATAPKLLNSVDVMVVPSHNETFGVVAAEALMMGLPVIATRCGGPECIVKQGDGVLVPPRDEESLAAAMRQVGESLQSYDRLAIAQRARDRFSGPAIAARLMAIYESVLM